MSSLSAFAALQDEEVINYEANSDDSIDSNDESESNILQGQSRFKAPMASIIQLSKAQLQQTPQPVISKSNFTPNDDNLIFKEDYVIVGLKKNEFLLCHGQFNLIIQRGALFVNNNLFHASVTPIPFTSPTSHSIPILQSTQVLDRSDLVDTKTAENSHLFTSDYKTILRIETMDLGLGNIGYLYPPLKNLFHNNISSKNEDDSEIDRFQDIFKLYSFEIILKPSALNGLYMDKSWSNTITKLTSSTIVEEPPVILIIGNKNTGKSTLSNLFLNSFVHKNPEIGISYLDLDPGQPEFSLPDSISLSYHKTYVHGIPISSPEYVKDHYIGFNSPNVEPERYHALVQDLIDEYNTNFRKLLSPLIINFPGWIKGYGLKLLQSLTEKIQPTNLLYLTNNTLEEFSELSSLKYDECINLSSYKIVSKYSSNQLRILKKLLYFHRRSSIFNFQNILWSPPYQISYTDKFDLSYSGICGVSILNSNIDHSDLSLVIDASIVALYGINVSHFSVLQDCISLLENQPPLLASNVLNDTALKFYGLCLIHSIDNAKKEINLYTPIDITKLNEDKETFSFVLVKGMTDYPLNEFVIDSFTKLSNIPYLDFNNKKFNKTSNFRRNINRRNQL